MKSVLYSIGILFTFVSCTEHDISPNLKGELKKSTIYYSSNLEKPEEIWFYFYNNSGQLVKNERHEPDEGMTKYIINSYDLKGNYENKKSYEKESGEFLLNWEDKYYYDYKSQQYKSESYLDGALHSVNYSFFDNFGNITQRIDSTFENNDVHNSYSQYDSLNRYVSFSSYSNLQHNNSTIYDYKGSGMDRSFKSFFGEDSIIWEEGEEQFVDKKLILSTTFNHVDNGTYIRKYFYNEYNDLTKETFEKNGDERVSLENQYNGELLIEHKRYLIDLSRPSVDYYLTTYEYY